MLAASECNKAYRFRQLVQRQLLIVSGLLTDIGHDEAANASGGGAAAEFLRASALRDLLQTADAICM